MGRTVVGRCSPVVIRPCPILLIGDGVTSSTSGLGEVPLVRGRCLGGVRSLEEGPPGRVALGRAGCGGGRAMGGQALKPLGRPPSGIGGCGGAQSRCVGLWLG